MAETVATYSESNVSYGLLDEGQWSLRADGAYTRACGCAETSFYWDSVHNGTADTLENIVIDVRSGVPVRSIFNQQNVTRAWVHMKQVYPLLGAQVEEEGGHPRFIVYPNDLKAIRSDELIFKQAYSEGQASAMLRDIVNRRRTLSTRYLARIYILIRSDAPQRVHIIYQIAHIVVDGMSQATLKSEFLDLLVKECPPTPSLQSRLALALSMSTLWPTNRTNSPQRRWRYAIAAVMSQLHPMSGGHTIPHKRTTATPYSTVMSDQLTIEVAPSLSAKILAGCKKAGVTFGCVLPVIGQIAATRVLFRSYMSGNISEEEWEFRKREPMFNIGPLNARPMMDKRWFEEGGKSHVCLAIDYFAVTLPFMPLGELRNVGPSPQLSNPLFSAFLSKGRFLLRCEMVKRQLQRLLSHPLLFEKGDICYRAKVKRAKELALKWVEEQKKPEDRRNRGTEVSPIESSRAGLVLTHAGSSFGVTDDLYPVTFPLELKPGEEPIMRIERNELQLHCRPAQLYLGSTFGRGRLCLFIHYDTNAFERSAVEDYMSEICEAAEWYLANATSVHDSGASTKL